MTFDTRPITPLSPGEIDHDSLGFNFLPTEKMFVSRHTGEGWQDVGLVPMGEFWMHQWSHVKLASSAAHTYGKRLVALESFTETRNHFAIRPARMKQRVDEAFLLGGNYLTMAVSEWFISRTAFPRCVCRIPPIRRMEADDSCRGP